MMTPDAFFKRYGSKRLLKLAKILDTADAKHKEKGEPTYDQCVDAHPCGTPACAGGHWNVSVGLTPGTMYRAKSFYSSDTWGITDSEWLELFGPAGCNNAQTSKDAAKYIRAFVKRKLKELSK